MKNIKKYRLIAQIIFLIITASALFLNFEVGLLLLTVLTILSGVFYCGWMCPFGFIQDVFSKLGRKIGIKKRKVPMVLHRILIFVRYIIFALVLFMAADIIFAILSFDPRVAFSQLLLGNVSKVGALLTIICFALLSMFFDRPFCNYFCYEGAKYGLMSIFRVFTIKRNESNCIGCKKCDNVCPMNIAVSKCNNLRSAQCINCFECVNVCPVDDTLKFGTIKMNKKEKKIYIALAIAVVLFSSSFMLYNIFNDDSLAKTQFTKQSDEKVSEETESPSEISVSEQDDEDGNNLTVNEETADNNWEQQPSETNIIPEDENISYGDAAGIADGVYTGEGKGFKGTTVVEVTVKDQKIAKIEIISNQDDEKWFERAKNIILDKIIEEQSTDVDLVSGATYSSIGIRDAVIDALNNAK
ncbi:FMN-binding protein [Anaerovorax odorimutans]|uniref:FMN-binding protein n=1 Tax=Anaerovorax odorimutans TaxID=109327 RepID=UPI00042A1C65|nr:FMN-binding protein [Anaerovorax odorimutans]